MSTESVFTFLLAWLVAEVMVQVRIQIVEAVRETLGALARAMQAACRPQKDNSVLLRESAPP